MTFPFAKLVFEGRLQDHDAVLGREDVIPAEAGLDTGEQLSGFFSILGSIDTIGFRQPVLQ
jgi:hypothetical protein